MQTTSDFPVILDGQFTDFKLHKRVEYFASRHSSNITVRQTEVHLESSGFGMKCVTLYGNELTQTKCLYEQLGSRSIHPSNAKRLLATNLHKRALSTETTLIRMFEVNDEARTAWHSKMAVAYFKTLQQVVHIVQPVPTCQTLPGFWLIMLCNWSHIERIRPKSRPEYATLIFAALLRQSAPMKFSA
jgi:hypothetical protein